jgi:hypothetical protein
MQIDQTAPRLHTDRAMTQWRLWTLVGLIGWTCTFTAAAQVAVSASVYKSEIDELLTIESVSILPFSDNVQGIYSRPLENHFAEMISGKHRWDLRPVNAVGPILSPEDLEDDLEKAKLMAGGISADAFFACRISKGPNGVTIILSLFLTKDAKLLAKAVMKDAKRFDVAELKNQLELLLSKVTAQIPYQGRVLSRDNQRVTVSIGKKDGIQSGQIVSVVQIISITRHPKFNFIISSEKEIIGRIKILKVDDTLSFGTLVTEKEKGAVRKNAKIAGLDFVTYPESDNLADPSGGKDLAEREDSKVTFGDNPTAWLPQRTPTFGQVGARLGNSFFTTSVNVETLGSMSSTTFVAPSVALEGEIWVTQALSVHAGFKQGVMTLKNPRDGSAPPDLNLSLTEYELMFGYNFRFGATVWGPNLEALAGYFNYRLYIDNSTPESYTTMNYTGFKFGVKGHFPITNDERWAAGAELYMVFNPNLSESPVTSGADATNTVNMFGIFGWRKLTENTKLFGKLDLEQFSTSFSGDGTRVEDATSSSQRLTTLSLGLYYLF